MFTHKERFQRSMIIRSDRYRRRYGKKAAGGISVNYNRGNPARQRECETEPMEIEDLTPEQLGMILFRVNSQSRKSAKRYLHDIGCPADSESLDLAIERANASESAKLAAEQIKAMREDLGIGLDAASKLEKQAILDLINEYVESFENGHVGLAAHLAWHPSQLSNLLSGRTTMSVLDLCRLAIALGLKIKLEKN